MQVLTNKSFTERARSIMVKLRSRKRTPAQEGAGERLLVLCAVNALHARHCACVSKLPVTCQTVSAWCAWVTYCMHAECSACG
jgi:hypothetical protein